MERRSILLDGTWTMCVVRHQDVVEKGIDPRSVQAVADAGGTVLQARVPGNFELDLRAAGLLDDLFVGLGILQAQELEDRHVWYARSFDCPWDAGETDLVFEGIDTFAEILLNGQRIAATDNMLIPHRIPATGLRAGRNELVVHIRPTTLVARSLDLDVGCFAMKYSWESLKVRKAPHMYGWDIMPRAVSAGIWRSVRLERKPADRIDEAFLYTTSIDRGSGTAAMTLIFRTTIPTGDLSRYRIQVTGAAGTSSFRAEATLTHTAGRLLVHAGNVRYWWPKDLGEPALYDTEVTLLRDGAPVDVCRMRHGIRTVALDRTSTTDQKGNGEFCFRINGEKLFVKGTNWVPVDAFHSRDKERLPRALALLGDIGCNAVRCWGGNVYEDDVFYDYCDANGIVVWQDFALACAVYPQDEAFAKALAVEVDAVVRRLRNHPSIVLWAGDNECDYAYAYWDGLNRDPNTNALTRRVIPEALKLADPTRTYLPSSPYIDETAFKKGFGVLPEDHLWGPRDYFKSAYYAGSIAHFASEMGYHGCPSPVSIRRFLSKDRVWPWQGNEEWLVHAASPETSPDAPWAYRIELMAKQVRELFGRIPEDLDAFAYASQVSQAEAFKYFIELFRATRWRRTGIIWWNLLDGWPQFSDAVVDYYYEKKLAYDYIRRSQQPVCLMFTEPDNWEIGLVAANDRLSPARIEYVVKDLTQEGKVVLEGRTDLAPNASRRIASLKYSMGEKHFYLIEWTEDGVVSKNHYVAGTPPYDLDVYRRWMQEAGL